MMHAMSTPTEAPMIGDRGIQPWRVLDIGRETTNAGIFRANSEVDRLFGVSKIYPAAVVSAPLTRGELARELNFLSART